MKTNKEVKGKDEKYCKACKKEVISDPQRGRSREYCQKCRLSEKRRIDRERKKALRALIQIKDLSSEEILRLQKNVLKIAEEEPEIPSGLYFAEDRINNQDDFPHRAWSPKEICYLVDQRIEKHIISLVKSLHQEGRLKKGRKLDAN